MLYVILMGAALRPNYYRRGTGRGGAPEAKFLKDVSRMKKFRTFMDTLAEEGQILEVRELLRELTEVLHYSDPVSGEALKEIEDTLADGWAHLQDAVALLEKEKALELCWKTKRALEERNQICMLHKHER